MTVDGLPAVHACTTPCGDGMRVERPGGWPNADRDLMHVTDSLHRVMPVGFYYKTFIRPRFAWTVAERVIRRATGLGTLPQTTAADRQVVRHQHVAVLVIGAGIAGLEAARDAGAAGADSVLVCNEGPIGRGIAPGPTRDRLLELASEVRSLETVTVLEDHTALGLYEGLHVPLAGDGVLVHVHPARVVVATGAAEEHGIFPGNDLPGVMLGRAAAALAGVHGVRPGDRAVVVVRTDEGLQHLRTVVDAGVQVIATAVSAELADRLPEGVGEIVIDGEVHEALGGASLRSVVLRRAGRGKRFDCDVLVLSLGFAPRDGLARMALPSEAVSVVGDAALRPDVTGACGHEGTVCLCEDVSMHDLEQAWDEGYRNAEILKRYTTTTMGPCQGAMCGRALSCFAAERGGAAAAAPVSGVPRTTSRPPTRAVTLETLAAGVHEIVDKRTSLHDVHVTEGARLDRSGGWLRPFSYGDWREEYRSVRERVSLMDVGTLGKFTIAGPDADALVDRVFPCRTDDLPVGRTRYVLTLDEAGYVMDDGLLARTGAGEWFLTSTSGGAGRTDARLRNFADRLDFEVHLLDRTAQWGAINVTGPHARDLLQRLTDDAVDVPYPGFADITGGRRAVPGDPERVHRRARVRTAPSSPARSRAVVRARRCRSRVGPSAARARRARAAAPGEGAHLPGPGHDARRHPGQAGDVVGGGHGEALVRRQARARAHGRAADVATARGARVHPRPLGHRRASRGAAPGGGHGGRSHHVGRAFDRPGPGDRPGMDANVRRGLPRSGHDGLGHHGDGRAHALLRPGRRADAWLSCGSISPRWSRCSPRPRPATGSRPRRCCG